MQTDQRKAAAASADAAVTQKRQLMAVAERRWLLRISSTSPCTCRDSTPRTASGAPACLLPQAFLRPTQRHNGAPT